MRPVDCSPPRSSVQGILQARILQWVVISFSRGEASCLQCRSPGFGPWVGKIPWRRKWQPTPALLPGKSHGQRSVVGYSPRVRKESDCTDQLHFHISPGDLPSPGFKHWSPALQPLTCPVDSSLAAIWEALITIQTPVKTEAMAPGLWMFSGRAFKEKSQGLRSPAGWVSSFSSRLCPEGCPGWGLSSGHKQCIFETNTVYLSKDQEEGSLHWVWEKTPRLFFFCLSFSSWPSCLVVQFLALWQ